MIDRGYICSCICIIGTISGFIGVPLAIVGVSKLPSKLSDEEMRSLNVQEQRNLLTQRVFDSEGWKYCISGFVFIGFGIFTLGCVLLYFCIVRARLSISPEPESTQQPTLVLSAIAPRQMRSSSTTGALPPTSAASVPLTLLESHV